jgi:hypothetical protein
MCVNTTPIYHNGLSMYATNWYEYGHSSALSVCDHILKQKGIKLLYSSFLHAHLIISDQLLFYLTGKPPGRNDARFYTHGFGWSGCYRIIGGVTLSIISV